MRKSFVKIGIVTGMAMASIAAAQHPVVDKIADKVIQKYQTTSCAELMQKKAASQGKAPSEKEQRALQYLHQDAGARAEFFNKVSAPIVTKLFECGMIP